MQDLHTRWKHVLDTLPEVGISTGTPAFREIEAAVAETARENEVLRHSLEQLSQEFVSVNQRLQRDLQVQNRQGLMQDPRLSDIRAFLDSMPDPLLVTSADGKVIDYNSGWSQLFGRSIGNIAPFRSRPVLAVLASSFEDPGRWGRLATEATGPDGVPCRDSIKLRDGRECEVRVLPLQKPSDGLLWLFRDTTEFAQVQNRLKESEERFRLAAASANDGWWDWQLGTNELYLSPRWLAMLGYSEQDMLGSLADWLNLVHPADKRAFASLLKQFIAHAGPRFQHEYRILDKSGEYRWMRLQGSLVKGADGQPQRFAGSQTDITDRKRIERQLMHDSLHDALTGLPNRMHFRERLNHAVLESNQDARQGFTVLQFNLLGFQRINDALGHLFGDQVLLSTAQRLSAFVNDNCMAARLGDDEFAVLMERSSWNEDEALTFAKALRETLCAPMSINGRELEIAVSMGVLVRQEGHTNVAEVLADVATATHRAKQANDPGIVVFYPEMHALAVGRLEMELRLRKAIEQGEIEVYYQPIVSAETGIVCGLEALARWRHPERGLVQPAEFIPLSEETGLIIPLGNAVLAAACTQVAEWVDIGFDLWVSVNLSPRQFRHPGLPGTIASIVNKSGLPPSRLLLEITESQLVEDPERAVVMLEEIDRLGIRLAIDDFGTGYSSLGYLKRYPIHAIKIDRSFVSELPHDHEDAEITRAILALAQNLNLRVTAEGVENIDQSVFLRNLSCEQLQGFHFAKPMPASEVLGWLRTNSLEQVNAG